MCKDIRAPRKQQGFTLIEIMVVIFIIGLLGAIVLPQFMGQRDIAQLRKAAVDIQNLENAVNMYQLSTNSLPTTEQGLEALVQAPTIDPIPKNYPNGGVIQRLPKDPWGNDYILLNPGQVDRIDIYSMGPDGQDGTDDDIGTWNLNDYLQ